MTTFCVNEKKGKKEGIIDRKFKLKLKQRNE